MERGGAVYILTNKHNTTLYIGVTADLASRLIEHIDKKHPGSFSAKYNLNKLVYYEFFPSIEEAITREKLLKATSRASKTRLIEEMNPDWQDLGKEVLTW